MNLGNINFSNLPQHISGELIHTTRPEPIPHMQLTSLSVKELRLGKEYAQLFPVSCPVWYGTIVMKMCVTPTPSLEVHIISFSVPHWQKWPHISVIRTKTSESGLSLSQTAALDHDSTAQPFCQKR